MLIALLSISLLFVGWIAYRIYSFLRATNAPILQGKRQRNIRYKRGRKLDVYHPTQQIYDRAPVLVFLHGGGWVMGSRLMVNNARFHLTLNALRAAGYAIVAPAYTKASAGRSPFPACLEDVADALAWVRANADKYSFDADEVGILGESAGAHIGLMVTYSPPDAFTDKPIAKPKYLVDVYGPAHLHRLYQDLDPMLDALQTRTERWPRLLRAYTDVRQKLFGFDPKAEPERALEFAKAYSPYLRVHADVPPTLIVHGEYDRLVPVSQSFLLKEKLEEFGVPHQLQIVHGMGHSFRGATPAQRRQVQEWIVDFARSHMGELSGLAS